MLRYNHLVGEKNKKNRKLSLFNCELIRMLEYDLYTYMYIATTCTCKTSITITAHTRGDT